MSASGSLQMTASLADPSSPDLAATVTAEASVAVTSSTIPVPTSGGSSAASSGLLSSPPGSLLTGSLLLLAGFLSLVVGARRRSAPLP